MAFQLTPTALALANQTNISPQLILEIEDIPISFGTNIIEYQWRLDEGFFIDDGLRLDTPVADPNGRDLISLDKTTKNITQLITPDKGGTSSVSSLNIELVDKNEELSRLFKNGNFVNDLLSKQATVFMTFKGATHPVDSIPIMFGSIDEVRASGGAFQLRISHPESKKRSSIFQQFQAELGTSIDDTETQIQLSTIDGLIQSADVLTSFLRLDEEIVELLSVDENTGIATVLRGQLNTTAVSHDVEESIESIYKLQGDPIDLILKLYLSSPEGATFETDPIKSINQITNIFRVQNAINFGELNPQVDLGLIVGDTITISSSQEPANDGDYLIESFGEFDGFFYAVVDGLLVDVSDDSDALATFKSQFNVLGEGLGLSTREVDVQGHLDIVNFNPNTLPELTFYLDSDLDAKSFIDEQIMFPVALYSIPRKARISLKIVQPPLKIDDAVILDETTVTNISRLSAARSTNQFLYNQIVYKYEKQIGEEKFLRGKIYQNEDSFNRIRAGRKQLKINSQGLRATQETENLLDTQARKIFERYQFAAQQINNVEVLYGDAYNVEVGDIVIFGSENVQITDLETGERVFSARLMEVVNKKLNFINGRVELDLLESAYGLNARYGVISLSSFTTSGSSGNELKLKKSFDVGEYTYEGDKWREFITDRIRVRSDDYSYDETYTIIDVKPSNPNTLILREGIVGNIEEDYICEIPEYDNQDARVDRKYKDYFVYNNYQADIINVISESEIEVDDASLIPESSKIYIHNSDFTNDSFKFTYTIVNITNNIIELDRDLEFLPQIGDKVEKADYLDGGFAYSII